METILVSCPYCNGPIIIGKNELNCCIFRHAVYKRDMTPIHPHMTKDQCERLLKDGLIWGCARPFRILRNNDQYIAEICDYI